MLVCQSTIATKTGVTASKVFINEFSRRADLTMAFTVYTGSTDAAAAANTASALKSFMEDTSSTGFASKFNAAAWSYVTTTGVTVTSEPTTEVTTVAPEVSF